MLLSDFAASLRGGIASASSRDRARISRLVSAAVFEYVKEVGLSDKEAVALAEMVFLPDYDPLPSDGQNVVPFVPVPVQK